MQTASSYFVWFRGSFFLSFDLPLGITLIPLLLANQAKKAPSYRVAAWGLVLALSPRSRAGELGKG